MKVYGQLEKAQLENTTSDTASHPKGMITYRTDLNQAKVSNGTTYKLLIDEDSTQTLSNKTYANPSITGAITSAQTTTPANPSSGSNKLYFKADGKLYTLDSSGNEAIVGSGTGGVKNLITNGNADDTSSSIFVPYADAASTRPVDGTGGSPTVTTSMTTSTPLDGVKSFLLTKPASNVQGQGWSVPFTVDPAYRAKSLKISVDYIVNSGTFVAGGTGVESDVIWYIYDVTNSQLIEPSNIKMFSNNSSLSDKFEATFQSSATGSSYRLIAHVQSVSALAYELKVDNITVSPQTYVFGTPVTDWVPYNATVAGFGTISSSNFEWRRVGDSVQVKGRFTSGTSTATAATISLPNGIIVDSTKVPNQEELGEWHTNSTATSGFLFVSPGGNTMNMSIGTGLDNNLGNAIAASGGVVVFSSFSIPISGWSSNVQMSNDTDTRIVDFEGYVASNQALTANTTNLPLTARKDSHAAWGGSSYTVPVAGDYLISAVIINSSGSGSYYTYLNGSSSRAMFTATTSSWLSGSVLWPNLKAGDVISIRNNASVTALGDAGSSIMIQRLSGPATIAATETVTASYTTAAGQSISNSTTDIINFDTKDFDTRGAVTTGASWKFTAPISGFYNVSSVILFASSAATQGNAIDLQVFKNGSVYKRMSYKTIESTFTNFIGTQGQALVTLNAGDYIDIRVSYNRTGGNTSLHNSSTYNHVEISRIK